MCQNVDLRRLKNKIRKIPLLFSAIIFKGYQAILRKFALRRVSARNMSEVLRQTGMWWLILGIGGGHGGVSNFQ